MKKSIQIKRGTRKIKENDFLLESEKGNWMVINLSWRQSWQRNARQRKINKIIWYMPIITKILFVCWIIMIALWILWKLNAIEIKNKKIELWVIQADAEYKTEDNVTDEQLEKLIENVFMDRTEKENEINEVVIPKKEKKMKQVKKVAVTAHVRPTIKNWWIKVEWDDFDLDLLARAVAWAETHDCGVGNSAAINNCFWIMQWDKYWNRSYKSYNTPEESYEDFKRIWTKGYRGYPNMVAAKSWTGNDRPESWLRNVTYYYETHKQ